ncbi:peptidase S8 [Aquimarina sp. AD10]|uniref:S8 family serine peptidase n=1 Tax=Aquimarina sp. AD10 TaxID=1714849 RepID=UPI000E4FFEDD|nr:S8 family serine peptidase [Aquimarina sp. AD10]AXT61891.1 peptidase S8 [Aquimarina sp. AD10]RKN02351.1 peptidase S8 [Aquimarina sp. AD10]
MKLKTIFFFFSIPLLNYAQAGNVITKQQELSEHELKNWYHKDLKEDTIPGISLDKAYKELLYNKKGKEIIVAVLDTKLDIHHEDIKQQLWLNTDEIANNGIDDDQNGYIDDIHGWDFLGNTKGEYLKYENTEAVRILRKYTPLFKDKAPETISQDQKELYELYSKAKKRVNDAIQEEEDFIKYAKNWLEVYPKAKGYLNTFFPKNKYTISQLDSLSNTKPSDSLAKAHIQFIKRAITYELTPEFYEEYIPETQEALKTVLNVDYKERELIGDNPNDNKDLNYGYNQVYGDVPFQHSIVVSGVLAATRNNNIGIKGVSDNIKIMPVVMVASGDEHDKDIVSAIRYAVDNGAKVINMSWGKDFSLHKDWVQDAMKYAEKNDVLLVAGGGNDGRSNDTKDFFPIDYKNDKEIIDNYIVVGATTHALDKNLVAFFSNYGKKNVDVFAPGEKIYTTDINNKYEFSRGTSIASPITAGVAALIRSYYPNLSASQVKKVILESGTSYDIDVEITGENGEKKLIPFSELSKSGKIVNAYNALLLAEKMSKNKK